MPESHTVLNCFITALQLHTALHQTLMSGVFNDNRGNWEMCDEIRVLGNMHYSSES